MTVVTEWQTLRSAHPKWPERPSAGTRYGFTASQGWQARIGQLMPDDRDRWWRIRSGDPTGPIARAVVEAMRKYGLPALPQHIDLLSMPASSP